LFWPILSSPKTRNKSGSGVYCIKFHLLKPILSTKAPWELTQVKFTEILMVVVFLKKDDAL
jgi:hypothetical protein